MILHGFLSAKPFLLYMESLNNYILIMQDGGLVKWSCENVDLVKVVIFLPIFPQVFKIQDGGVLSARQFSWR